MTKNKKSSEEKTTLKEKTAQKADESACVEMQEEEVISLIDVETDPATQKAEEYKNLLQRLQAEFDNFRKRNTEATICSRNDGINDVFGALLPVMDNFERGLESIEEGAAKAGMELIYKQMKEIFKKFDVHEIEALGAKFNTDIHYAIAQEEGGEKPNVITEVFAKGYKRKNKVIRYAMVKVAK